MADPTPEALGGDDPIVALIVAAQQELLEAMEGVSQVTQAADHEGMLTDPEICEAIREITTSIGSASSAMVAAAASVTLWRLSKAADDALTPKEANL